MATKKKALEVTEKTVLRWPDGMERTRIKERKRQNAWRLTWKDYFAAVGPELEKMGATSVLITRSDNERMDPGVSVWWSMKKEDFSWQQGLALETPVPTLDQIDTAYREKARKVHPDLPGGGDPELFKRLTAWREQAKAWILGKHDQAHEYVMAIDQYDEARLNLCALRLAFSYIRGLERVGAPAILTQTLGAFRAKLVASTGGAA